MQDTWHMFAASMGEDQAWIAYNHDFSDVADTDQRNLSFRVRVQIKDPTPAGLPTNEEFPHLSALDESLEEAMVSLGGIYVGRVTVAGYRYFYYYLDDKEEQAVSLVDEKADLSGYELEYLSETDQAKAVYWNELYPTEDDWQVVKDLMVLDSLADNGDNSDISREVMHWAYFANEEQALAYKAWVDAQGYRLVNLGKTEEDDRFVVQFSHTGTMHLGDITFHTISANRMARELDGEYDGWETSIEK
ncbi:MAG: DUF695 domain-containing protein [Gammaproteobacteria bacterium]|nr:DUF695 domain-containing protein [Gammaproteobacteria bacterium]MDH5650623.1 DUF695 domain-containing protein [Gammaproteobacteria bacterium]